MTTFNPNTASCTELRDWIAEHDGWKSERLGDAVWWYHKDKRVWSSHPHPPTLDGAASAMPKGVRTYRDLPGGHAEQMWSAIRDHTIIAFTEDTGDEITDRYRLAAIARIKDEGEGSAR